MRGLGWSAARPGELLLQPEVTLLALASSARPGKLVTSSLSLLGAQASQGSEIASKWPFCPPFWVFSIFFCETLKNRLDCAATGVKQLNSASKNQKVSKRSSPDEIKEKKEKEEEKWGRGASKSQLWSIPTSFFVHQPISFYFKVLNSLYTPLGVLFVALHIFISFFYHQWSYFFM